jgi:hypothetical protein
VVAVPVLQHHGYVPAAVGVSWHKCCKCGELGGQTYI